MNHIPPTTHKQENLMENDMHDPEIEEQALNKFLIEEIELLEEDARPTDLGITAALLQ